MARAPKPPPAGKPTALILAERLRGAMLRDPDFALHDMPEQAGGAGHDGALFHLTDAEGRRYRVRVNRV